MTRAANLLPTPSMDDKLSSVASKPVSRPDMTAQENEREPRHKPRVLGGVRGLLRQIFGHRHDSSLKEVLEEVIEEHEEQTEEPLPPEEKIMLHNMLNLGDIKASDIMIPRPEIVALPHDITLDDLTRHIIEVRHTRIPVYEETLDHMLGFIHLKDVLPLFSGGDGFDMATLVRPLLFVPPSMRIIDVLVKMRHAGSHIAIVVDEYGGTDGLITMEDVIEEIVGDIHDEHDGDEEQKDRVVRINAHTFDVDARIPIESLERQLGLNLVTEEKEGEFDTLGGFIFFQIGRVPAKGEIVPHVSGVSFEIVDADPRRIRKVRIVTVASPSQ